MENENQEPIQVTQIQIGGSDVNIFKKILNAVKEALSDSNIRIGLKNKTMDADVNISKDSLQLNLKKSDKKAD